MRFSEFSRPIPQLVVLSLLALMIVSPANAQTSSEPERRELGAFALGAGTINPGTPDTGSYAATPTPETNEKAESEPGTQPDSNPSTAQPETETTGAN